MGWGRQRHTILQPVRLRHPVVNIDEQPRSLRDRLILWAVEYRAQQKLQMRRSLLWGARLGVSSPVQKARGDSDTLKTQRCTRCWASSDMLLTTTA